jgi:hypothetical protein
MPLAAKAAFAPRMAESLDMTAIWELYRAAALALDNSQYGALELQGEGDPHDDGNAYEEFLGDEVHGIVSALGAYIARLYAANTVTLWSGVWLIP